MERPVARVVSIVPALVTVALVLQLGCAGPQREPRTAAELVKENTLILQQLASYRQEEQQKGVRRFQKLGPQMGGELIVHFLNDPVVSGDERSVAMLAWILAGWEDARAIPYLAHALTTSLDGGIRELAAEGLGNFDKIPSVVARLKESVAADDVHVRLLSTNVLAKWSDSPEVLAILGERLKLEQDKDVRGACLLGIVEASPSEQRAAFLIDALTDTEPEIRELAWAVIEKEAEDAPRGFDPRADLATRARAVAVLRRWASSRRWE